MYEASPRDSNEPLFLPLASALDPEIFQDPDVVEVALVAGLVPDEQQVPRAKILISLGESPIENADLAFIAPGLDPRLRASVVRNDGVALTLCGEQDAPRDPAAAWLSSLRGRLNRESEVTS